MSLSKITLFTSLLLITLTSACAPQVGDECESSTQCPSGAICDNTVYEGYCTIPNCERDSCPENSVCIRFDAESSFCMGFCESDSDCRDGYACRTDLGPAGFCYIPDSKP